MIIRMAYLRARTHGNATDSHNCYCYFVALHKLLGVRWGLRARASKIYFADVVFCRHRRCAACFLSLSQHTNCIPIYLCILIFIVCSELSSQLLL